MPFIHIEKDEDFDPLEDHLLYKADAAFTSWDAEVAAYIETLLLTLNEYQPFSGPAPDTPPPQRKIEYTGTLNETVDHLARWIQAMPDYLARFLAHPALQSLFSNPELVFLIRKWHDSCSVVPHLLNYPPPFPDHDESPFIDFGYIRSSVKRYEEGKDEFVLSLPNDIAWSHTTASEVGNWNGWQPASQRKWKTEEEWLDILENGSQDQKRIAILFLRPNTSRRFVDALLTIFQDEQADELLRKAAAWGLGTSGDLRAIEPLYQAAIATKRKRYNSLGSVAFQAVIHFADPRVAEIVIETALHASHFSPHWRAAVRGLGKTNDPRALEYLTAILRKEETVLADDIERERLNPRADVTSQIRIAAARALGEMENPLSIVPLREALISGDHVARIGAAYALAIKGDYSGLSMLLDEWEQTGSVDFIDGGLLEDIIDLFGQLGEKRSIPILIDALRNVDTDYSYGIRRRAEASLKMITGQDFGRSRKQWRQWWNEQQMK